MTALSMCVKNKVDTEGEWRYNGVKKMMTQNWMCEMTKMSDKRQRLFGSMPF